jgi:hypothetical protein
MTSPLVFTVLAFLSSSESQAAWRANLTRDWSSLFQAGLVPWMSCYNATAHSTISLPLGTSLLLSNFRQILSLLAKAMEEVHPNKPHQPIVVAGVQTRGPEVPFASCAAGTHEPKLAQTKTVPDRFLFIVHQVVDDAGPPTCRGNWGSHTPANARSVPAATRRPNNLKPPVKSGLPVLQEGWLPSQPVWRNATSSRGAPAQIASATATGWRLAAAWLAEGGIYPIARLRAHHWPNRR